MNLLSPDELSRRKQRTGGTTRAFTARATTRNPIHRAELIAYLVDLHLEIALSAMCPAFEGSVDAEQFQLITRSALVRGATQFDPARPDDFLTYAMPVAHQDVKRYLRCQGWTCTPLDAAG